MAAPGGRWALVVHGGAKRISPEEAEDNRAGCLDALAAGRDILERGGSAVDAVEASIRLFEARPVLAIGRDGPEAAIAKALAQTGWVGGDAGGIAIDPAGRIGWWHNSPDFAVARASSDEPEPRVWLAKQEEMQTNG